MSRALRGVLALLTLAAFMLETAGCARKKFYGETASRIEVATGDDFGIELASNPTTGYTWVMTRSPDTTLAGLMSSDFKTDDANLTGIGGHQQFVFRAVGRGTTTAQFDYRRSWESGAPAKSVTFTIVIR